MDHFMFCRGQQPGPIFSEVVQIGAGGDNVGRKLANTLVEVRLAKVAPIKGIVAIANVVKLPSAGNDQMPAFLFGGYVDPVSGRGRHSRRNRMDDAYLGLPETMSEGRQSEAVYAAAHRHGKPLWRPIASASRLSSSPELILQPHSR
jgi:hypothetical protein